MTIVSVWQYSPTKYGKLDNGIYFNKLLQEFKHKLDPICLSTVEQDGSENDGDQELFTNYNNNYLNYQYILNELFTSLKLYNLEDVLLKGDYILNRLDLSQFSSEQQQRILYEVWHHVGIAQTFMGNLNQAIKSFEKMVDFAPTSGEQAKSYHLIAVVYGKRLKNRDKADEYVNKGLKSVKNSTDFLSSYEKGWLYNYLAYISYNTYKNFDDAMGYVQKAKECILPFKSKSPDPNIMNEVSFPISSERLIGNLKSNAAYLYYFTNNFEQSLNEWQSKLEGYQKITTVFMKEYYYFEGTLLTKLGRYQEAINSLEQSYNICKDYYDLFHQEIVARRLGYTYFIINDFLKAKEYYKESILLKKEKGQSLNYKDYQALIICDLVNNNLNKAEQLFYKYKDELNDDFKKDFLENNSDQNHFLNYLPDMPFVPIQPFPFMKLNF